MDHFGYWAILPPVLAIVAAIVTRQVFLSLTLGIVSAAAIFVQGDGLSLLALLQVPVVFVTWLIDAVTDRGHAFVIVFTLMLGALIALLQRSGGTRGFAEWALKWANTPRRALLVGWLLGLVVFIDDYFDTITVGTVMRPVTDTNRVSREKLAYLVDTTAAPVAVMAPVSTWVGVIVATIAGAGAASLLGYSAFEAFLRSIPFNFYSIAAMSFALFLILTRIDFGPMKTAEARARDTGDLLRPGAVPLQSKELDQFGQAGHAKPRVSNLVMPLVALVFVAVVSMWGTGYVFLGGAAASPGVFEAFRNADPFASLVYASFAAVIYAGLYFRMQKIVDMREFFEAIEVGFKAMLPAVMVLVLAWTIGLSVDILGLDIVMADLVNATIPFAFVPALVFVLAGLTAFATGTSFGTFIIMIPIAMSVAAAFDLATIPVLIAATVGGAVFGDHASPISDTTVLSSMASACDHVDHVRTQLPYASTAAGLAILGYLGYGVAFVATDLSAAAAAIAWLLLAVAAVLVAGALYWFHRVRGSRDDSADGAEAVTG